MGARLSTRAHAALSTSVDVASDTIDGAIRSFSQEYTFTDRARPTSDASAVREAVQVATATRVAVKCVPRKGDADADARVQNEIMVLKRVSSHPGIVSLVDMLEENEYWYLVLERVDGGDLFDRILETTRYEEPTARLLVEQLLLAVDYCHTHGVVHHDLRPETILLVAKDDDVSIKLTGFGMAVVVAAPSERSLTCTRGTPGYIAPEVVNGEPHGCASDVWSLGVITYILLCGSPPIYGDTDAEIIRKTKIGTFGFQSSVWEGISSDAKDFIAKALARNQLERWSASQLLSHEWIRGDASA